MSLNVGMNYAVLNDNNSVKWRRRLSSITMPPKLFIVGNHRTFLLDTSYKTQIEIAH